VYNIFMQSDSIGVILAAGEGKRMGSELPKGLINIGGQSVLGRLAEVVKGATGKTAIAVVGHKKEEVKKALGDVLIYAEQKKQLGTANALLAAKAACENIERIIVFYGDHPFVSLETAKQLLDKSKQSEAPITLASSIVPNFENEYKVFLNFARIVRQNGKIVGIREYKDANGSEKEILEVNPGYYVFKSDWLWPHLEKVGNNNVQREYYLTDLLHIAQDEGARIESIQIDYREAMGANSKEELEILEKFAL